MPLLGVALFGSLLISFVAGLIVRLIGARPAVACGVALLPAAVMAVGWAMMVTINLHAGLPLPSDSEGAAPRTPEGAWSIATAWVLLAFGCAAVGAALGHLVRAVGGLTGRVVSERLGKQRKGLPNNEL